MFLDASSTNQNLAIIMLCVCLVPIAVLIVVAFFIKLKKASKSKLIQDDVSEVDPEVRKDFYSAYGNEENVTEVKMEMSRIKVKVKDISLVDVDKLKELGAQNVLIIENEVRASFQDRAKYVYQIMK